MAALIHFTSRRVHCTRLYSNPLPYTRPRADGITQKRVDAVALGSPKETYRGRLAKQVGILEVHPGEVLGYVRCADSRMYY